MQLYFCNHLEKLLRDVRKLTSTLRNVIISLDLKKCWIACLDCLHCVFTVFIPVLTPNRIKSIESTLLSSFTLGFVLLARSLCFGMTCGAPRRAFGSRTARWWVSVLVWQSCAAQPRDSSSLSLSRLLILLLFMKSIAYHWRTTSMLLWPVQTSRIWRGMIVSNHSWGAWLWTRYHTNGALCFCLWPIICTVKHPSSQLCMCLVWCLWC